MKQCFKENHIVSLIQFYSQLRITFFQSPKSCPSEHNNMDKSQLNQELLITQFVHELRYEASRRNIFHSEITVDLESWLFYLKEELIWNWRPQDKILLFIDFMSDIKSISSENSFFSIEKFIEKFVEKSKEMRLNFPWSFQQRNEAIQCIVQSFYKAYDFIKSDELSKMTKKLQI